MTNTHGGARRGAGRKPGQVSAAKRAIAEMARDHAEDALRVLLDVAKDPTAAAAARVSAANSILDRGYGRPVVVAPEPAEDRLTQAVREINQRGSAMPIATAKR